MAIRRFIAIRGAPQEIYSDNGSNFVGASRELQTQINNGDLANTFTNCYTKWKFNPPAAPHMGGVWERLVRSVKLALESMMLSKSPNDETLLTVLKEAQAIVNSRPLTFVSLDTKDDEALTPNHFLMLSSNGVVQPTKSMNASSSVCRTDWDLARSMTDQFWRRWVKEYLPIITRRTKWFVQTKPLQKDDLVIVVDEATRNGWKRGVVEETIKGSDGEIRQVIVRTQSGRMKRAVCKVALLDLNNSKTCQTKCYGVENVVEQHEELP
ncbi:uncharacterized protein LOC134203005 [Armigeres subalbatus]|uniref:uncharacterized protein LOC134203005 n=1 Tax=Armigeres subalbatus TaxID=124917 RepID=UPI002ED5C878